MSRNRLNGEIAALFTRIVAAPSSARTCATARSMAGRSEMSTVTGSARPPARSIATAVAFAPPLSRSKTATAAPSTASRRLIAAPMPEPPPVTIAVLGSDHAGTPVTRPVP